MRFFAERRDVVPNALGLRLAWASRHIESISAYGGYIVLKVEAS